MTLKQDMKVYYETFPDALYGCDFCARTFRTVAGLRTHALRMHPIEPRPTASRNAADAEIPGGSMATLCEGSATSRAAATRSGRTTAMHEHCRNWPCQLEDRHLGPCSTDTSGNCACVSANARWCYTIRYDVDPADDDLDDHRCECRCHSSARNSHHE